MGGDTMRKAFYGAALGIFVLSSLAASKALAQDTQAGAQVYQDQKCARCHGDGGKGDGPTAEKLKGKVEIVDWTNKAVMSGLTDEVFDLGIGSLMRVAGH